MIPSWRLYKKKLFARYAVVCVCVCVCQLVCANLSGNCFFKAQSDNSVWIHQQLNEKNTELLEKNTELLEKTDKLETVQEETARQVHSCVCKCQLVCANLSGN
jgi:hypothetical protein